MFITGLNVSQAVAEHLIQRFICQVSSNSLGGKAVSGEEIETQ